MKPQLQSFNKLASGVIADPLKRSRIIAAAVAVAVATQASLPSAPVDGSATYFSANVVQPASEEISWLNEELVFDCKQALAWARYIWMVRYGAAHPVAKPIFAAKLSFFESLMGVANYISPDDIEFFDENKTAVMALASNLCEVLCGLKARNAGADSSVAPAHA